MSEVASAYVSLIPSAKGFGAGIEKELGGSLTTAGRTGGEKASKIFGSSFKSGLKSLAAPIAGIFAIDKAVDFFKSANDEAREAQKVGALTTQVIKSTGSAAQVTAKHVGNLATAISLKTGIDDETIQSGANMLLTFKNIRNEAGKGNKVFDQSTRILTDVATAMGTEPKQAAIQLGKALNDPVKGISALTRVGVTFDKQQQKTIKHLVKTGHTMDAQKIILKELKSEFGGAAAAQATAGDKAAVAWGNLKEQIGTQLLPVVDKLSTWLSGKAIPAVSKFLHQMQSGKGAGGKFADSLSTIIDAGKTVATTISKIVGFLVKHKSATIALTGAIVALVAITKIHSAVMAVEAAGGLLKYLQATKLVTAATKVWTAVQWAFDAAMDANPISLVIIAIAALVAGIIIAYKKSETFRNIVDTAFHAIGEAGKWLWNNALQPMIKFILDGFSAVADKIGDFLEALSHIPGFGWAKTAADFMHNAADKAQELANNINKIQDKTAVVTIDWQQRGIPPQQQLINAGIAGSPGVRMRANGGPVDAGSPYIVGERGPELFVPGRSGSIIPHGAMRAAAAGPRRVQLVVGGREFDAYVREQAGSQYVTERRYDRVSGSY